MRLLYRCCIFSACCASPLLISQGLAADVAHHRPVKSAAMASTATAASAVTVELPLLTGWYQGKLLYYISTDMSDQSMAQQAGINYAPRLSALNRMQQPGQPSALDRVYKVINASQGSVFASAPEPIGARNGSDAYTPLWHMYTVTWRVGVTPYVLHSEEEVLDAEEKQRVTLSPTHIIVNCPIVYSPNEGALNGAKVHGKLPVQ